MKITTNNVPRDLLMPHELPAGIMESEFDYVSDPTECGARFFKYRGAWYDVNEFTHITRRAKECGGFSQPVDGDSPIFAWDGIQTETYFSGIVIKIKFADDGERVIVGSVYS